MLSEHIPATGSAPAQRQRVPNVPDFDCHHPDLRRDYTPVDST